MPRGSKSPSEVFNSVLSKAAKQLLLDADKASDFEHKGIKGDERAGPLAAFMNEHLPKRFSIAKGEAIDFKDNRTGQLDILIFDTMACAPLIVGTENHLVPAESLYAVIEVKSILTKQHLESSFANAGKLKQLRPYKKKFITARKDGSDASDGNPRCIHVIFAYKSDIKKDGWASAEYARISAAASLHDQEISAIDRVIVLDRGVILPKDKLSRTEDATAESLFLEFYLHITNFILREHKRREPIDWQLYGPRSTPGWKKIT